MRRIIINASNIHRGGGAVLMREIISCLPKNIDIFILHDKRFEITTEKSLNIKYKSVRSNLFSRLAIEYWLFKKVKKNDIVLFFGNLPPIFKLNSFVFVFLQNRFLIDTYASSKYLNFYSKIRILYERIILSFFKDNADEFIVQSQSMQQLLEIYLKKKSIKLPFKKNFLKEISNKPRTTNNNNVDFIYVASQEKHKNHINLLKAWFLLAEEDIFPSLTLTLNKRHFESLLDRFDSNKNVNKIKIYNIEPRLENNIYRTFKNFNALIYPSLIESYGLPLIEAKSLGIPIIASELDFVRDIVEPDYTFDPKSSKSISRAVKRFLKISSQLDHPIETKSFVDFFVNYQI